MRAGDDADAVQRPLALELLADLAEHRHLARRPFDPAPPVGGQTRILDVKRRALVGDSTIVLSLLARPRSRAAASAASRVDRARQPLVVDRASVLRETPVESIDEFVGV